MGEKTFNLPPDLDFECTQCGRCCRDRWEIRVDAPSAEKLLARPWPGLEVEKPFKKRLPLAPDDLPWTVERKPCGSCVFLETKANLCRIHRELGLEEKPQVCQQFPFLFAEDPDGVTVGLSHYCPGVRRVARATEPPLAKRLPELRRLHEHAIALTPVKEQVELDLGLLLAWPDWVALEELLRELVAAPGVSPRESLTAATIAVSMLVDFLAPRGTPPLGATREFVAGWRKMGLGRILALASRQRAKPRTGRLLLRQFLSLVDATASGSRLGAFSGALAFVKELLGVGSLHCVPLEARVSIGAVRAVELAWEDGEPLRRYAEHALFRRRLLPVLGARVGLALLVLQVAAARYVERGIQLVEKHYAAHSSLSLAFQAGPARDLFRKVAARPRYAWAVLGA